MTKSLKDLAIAALEGAESDNMTFPESVKLLREADFDGYAVDFRRAVRIYYLPDGETIELATERTRVPVAERFDVAAVIAAIREAQAQMPGYTYRGFCARVMQAGCAGYFVSFPGKRVLYYGRTAETHIEYFPGSRRTPANDPRCDLFPRQPAIESFAGFSTQQSHNFQPSDREECRT
jgi:uncharacterized protein YbcV (DUF1398 family)